MNTTVKILSIFENITNLNVLIAIVRFMLTLFNLVVYRNNNEHIVPSFQVKQVTCQRKVFDKFL